MGVRRKSQTTIQSSALPPRAMRCYRELIRFVNQHGYVPSYAELGDALGCSASTVGRYLVALQKAGLVRRRKRRARTIVIKRQLRIRESG